MITRRSFIINSTASLAGALMMAPLAKGGTVHFWDKTHAKPISFNPSRIKPDFPFIFGAQYYRAPTPDDTNWEPDFVKINEIGLTDVKFFVQWRWSHRTGDNFVFDDLDRLMDIAHSHKIRVTLNILFDVSPLWLFEKYPDAKQIMNNGQIIEPYVVGHRQIGGHPGPCYNHPGALEERKKFMRTLVNHFKKHPSLAMWDIWNEPELSYPQRTPDLPKLACYCHNCQEKFKEWLKRKYSSVELLNKTWGRCYENWDQVEVPRSVDTFIDFIDWREFHSETMTYEARWRLEIAKELDPERIHYLHVVPNTLQPFNPVTTCADDFEMAKYCDVFAATMNNGPFFTPQVISAGRGKICYNVESHINGGNTGMHQNVVELPDLLRDFLPQIGMGIKGFLFWQYRSETLGIESPAWGLVNLDGSERPVTRSAKTFWSKISPIKEQLMKNFPKPAQIAIWKSRKNEIFHFCKDQSFDPIASGINAYAEAAYWNSYNYRFVNETMLENSDLEDIKLLIMPSDYYVTEKEAEGLDKWVSNGGVLIAEAHLAGYNGTIGRHSRVIPGCGLAEKWGIKEIDSVSSFRLKPDQSEMMKSAVSDDTKKMKLSEDTRKMLRDFGVSGSKYYPIRMESGTILWGAETFAKIEAQNATSLGWFYDDLPCIVQKLIGKGTVIYCATNIGEGSAKDKTGFMELFNHAVKIAGINPNLEIKGPENALRVDSLYNNNSLEFIVIRNNSPIDQTINLQTSDKFKGLFTDNQIINGSDIRVAKGSCDIYYKL
jgi:hypothetical protein